MFGWFKSERRERRKKVRQDRKRLEARAQRFLKSYLEADEVRKPEFYRAVEDISNKCRPPDLDFSQPDLNDGQIAEATSKAAMQMVVERENRRIGDFVIDACATVAVAYHRAAGVYEADAHARVRNCRCPPTNDGNVLYQRTERMIYGSQFRTLKSVTAFIENTSTSDLVTIVGIAWSGVSIDWDDGYSTLIQRTIWCGWRKLVNSRR
jgi:hypothetical protein